MKKFTTSVIAKMAMVAAVLFTACSDDKESVNPNGGGDSSSNETHHLDLWLSVVGTTNTGSYVVSNNDVTNADNTVHVNGVGAEVTNTLVSNAIQKGKYYYFTTADNVGLAKYQVVNNQIVEVSACPFKRNVFKRGSMTVGLTVAHAWIGDDVLMLMSYSSATKKHFWTKFNVSTMSVVSEGELDLHAEYADVEGNSDGSKGAYKFSTTGHLRYRKSDGALIFFSTIHLRGEGNHPMMGTPNTKRGPLAVLAIKESDMTITEANTDDRVSGLGLESYGDTQQEKAFVTPEGDIYLICLEGGSTYSPGGPIREGVFVRVKSGESNTDRSYLYTPTTDQDFLVVRYIAPGKALVFSGDHAEYGYQPSSTPGSFGTWNSYAYYYAIFNYESKTMEKVKFNGSDLPWSTGNFNNYISIIGNNVYMGINAKSDETYTDEDGEVLEYPSSSVYVYNTKNGNVTQGFKIDEQLRFDRMFAVENN